MSGKAATFGQTTAAGALWLVLQAGGGRAIGFLSQLVVAAILLPSDFGLVGLAYTVSTFGAMLVNYGVESVLLQRQRTMRFWIAPAFCYSFGLGIAGLLLVAAIGPVAARLYAAPDVTYLAAIIALGIPVAALATVPNVLLRTRLQFKAIAGIGLAETLLIQALTIAGALAGLGAYAFVLPLPAVALLRTALVWWMTRPDLSGLLRGARRIKYLTNTSLAVFATGVVQSAISQGDYIVLGLLSNEAVVGVYFFAFKMASQPLLMMGISLSNVLFPALSQMRDAPAEQGAAAFRAAKLLGLLIMPMAFLQAAMIEPALHIFFPSKWDASIPLMQVLSVAFGFDAISWVAAALVTAQGGFHRQLRYVLASAGPFFLFVTLGAWFGSALGAAAGVTAYYVLVTPLYSYAVFRRSGMRLGPLAWLYMQPAIAAAVAAGSAVALTAASGVAQHWLRAGMIGGLGTVLYAALLYGMDRTSFNAIQSIVQRLAFRQPRRSLPA